MHEISKNRLVDQEFAPNCHFIANTLQRFEGNSILSGMDCTAFRPAHPEPNLPPEPLEDPPAQPFQTPTTTDIADVTTVLAPSLNMKRKRKETRERNQPEPFVMFRFIRLPTDRFL